MADASLGRKEVDKSSPGASDSEDYLKSTTAKNSKRSLGKRDSGYLSPGTPELATPSKTRSLHLGVPVRSQSSPTAQESSSPCSELKMPVRQSSQEQQQQQQQQQLPALKKNRPVKRQHSLDSSQAEVSESE